MTFKSPFQPTSSNSEFPHPLTLPGSPRGRSHWRLRGASSGHRHAWLRLPPGEQPWERLPEGASPETARGGLRSPFPRSALPGLAQSAQFARSARSEPAGPATTGHCRPPVAPCGTAGAAHPLRVPNRLSRNGPGAGTSLPEARQEQSAGPQGRVTLGSEQPPPKTQRAKGPGELKAGDRSWPRQVRVPCGDGIWEP